MAIFSFFLSLYQNGQVLVHVPIISYMYKQGFNLRTASNRMIVDQIIFSPFFRDSDILHLMFWENMHNFLMAHYMYVANYVISIFTNLTLFY